MALLGLDIGSSSVKAAILDEETGKILGQAFRPEAEMRIKALKPSWAEQNPRMWWKYVLEAIHVALQEAGNIHKEIRAIGISYQMHGLVCLDKAGEVVRPAIIWCDSRAVEMGRSAFEAMGPDHCLSSYLNSPGNFTASKLAWVKKYEPEIFEQIDKFMLPGDYIAYKLSGDICTTASGLSEGILWNFKHSELAADLLEHFGVSESLVADQKPSFGLQGILLKRIADELGLPADIPITYRAGDQPNNALSLNVLNPGEIAATAGTSGVIYGVTDQAHYDPQSRVNTFLHVNSTPEKSRHGILLCINGTGILNAWTRRLLGDISYGEMDDLAGDITPGSNGLQVFPFGNGAERVLGNQMPGAAFTNINFNIHDRGHICRALQEGIAFSFRYGLDIMREMGLSPSAIRAGNANMFLSTVFRETLATVAGCPIQLYDTDGAVGAARGAGIGAGIFASPEEAFRDLTVLDTTEPMPSSGIDEAYQAWKTALQKQLQS